MVMNPQVESSCLQDCTIEISLFITTPHNLSYFLAKLKENDNLPCSESQFLLTLRFEHQYF